MARAISPAPSAELRLARPQAPHNTPYGVVPSDQTGPTGTSGRTMGGQLAPYARHGNEGKTMADATISLEDRQAIYDTLARYVEHGYRRYRRCRRHLYARRRGQRRHRETLGRCGRWRQGICHHFLTQPNRRGGQHHVQHLLVEPANGGGYRVTSYLVSIQWDAEGDRKFIRAMGRYADTCIKVDGQWRIQEKIIDPWNSATAPMVGHML